MEWKITTTWKKQEAIVTTEARAVPNRRSTTPSPLHTGTLRAWQSASVPNQHQNMESGMVIQIL